jgi:hypothetical protein
VYLAVIRFGQIYQVVRLRPQLPPRFERDNMVSRKADDQLAALVPREDIQPERAPRSPRASPPPFG